MNANAQPWLDLGCGEPAALARPGTAEDVACELRRAQRDGLDVLPLGHGTRLGMGSPPERLGMVLLTEGIGRIIQYEPGDLTVTAEAGCALGELDRVLRERGQFLPLSAAGGRGTIGGLTATVPEGALSLGYGGVRDRLTGLRVALADGTIVKAGGRVVKNVAGYPLHRLMAGSFGTLGVIVEVSFRVQPLPAEAGAIEVDFASDEQAFEGAALVLAGGTEPVFANILLDGGTRRLVVGYDGPRTRVETHLRILPDALAACRPRGSRRLTVEENESLRDALDDPAGGAIRASGQVGPTRAVARLTNLPSRLPAVVRECRAAAHRAGASVAIDARPGAGSVFVTIEAPEGDAMRSALGAVLAAGRGGGHAFVFAAPADLRRDLDVWGSAPGDFALMRRMRETLDPAGLFTAGRFVGGL